MNRNQAWGVTALFIVTGVSILLFLTVTSRTVDGYVTTGPDGQLLFVAFGSFAVAMGFAAYAHFSRHEP